MTRFFRAGLSVAAAALLAFAVAIVVRTAEITRADSTQEAACVALLHFRTVLYTGQGVDPSVSLKHGQVLGEGTLPSCNDRQPPPGTTDAQDEEQVAVVALEA